MLNFKRNMQSLEEKHANPDATFKPKINPKSAEIVEASDLRGVRMEDRFEWAEMQKQDRLNKLQEEVLAKELAECSFVPQIDENSHKIAESQNRRLILMNQFSAIDMGCDLNEISEL